MARGFKAAGTIAARAAAEKKGGDILLIHTGQASPVSDYFLIVTALSPPHLETLEYEVVQALKAQDLRCIHRARPTSQQWRVLDFGGIVIHLMTERARDFYALEKLYPDSPRIRWAGNDSSPAKGPKRSAKKKLHA